MNSVNFHPVNKYQSKNDYIPTRYDDIQEEIRLAKLKDYFEQQKPIEVKSYKLGDLLGNKLDKVV